MQHEQMNLSEKKNTAFKSFVLCLISIFMSFVVQLPVYAEQPVRIIAIGDSLIAGHGLETKDGFTVQLENALQKRGHLINIVNSGVSGDTTHGGLSRLEWVLSEPYDAVILLLGFNDAFRAIPTELIRENLTEIIKTIQSRKLPLLLAGAQAPRNLGTEYVEEFDAIYLDLAKEFDVVFYPFFLEGVATDPNLNQDDRIHPNADGVRLIVEQILPYVEELIMRVNAVST